VTVRVDDAELTVVLDRQVVAPGGTVAITATLRNGRTTPLRYVPAACPGAATATIVLDPADGQPGRSWAGIAGELKTYALEQGLGPGGIPALGPQSVLISDPCERSGDEATLAPGESVTNVLAWRAELVDGVVAPAGRVVVTMAAAIDPRGDPPSHEPGQPIGMWMRETTPVTLDTAFDVAGGGAAAVPPGIALDAILADPAFATWLGRQPSSTWSVANLFLTAGDGGGIAPGRAAWDIELFRELGVPRNWAIGFVDAHAGTLIDVTYCDDPCDR
jgi:hypothetical protein